MSVVAVMPTWAPESWVESERTAARTDPAPRSPPAAARSTVDRSRATRENSAATNSAVPSVSRTPAPMSNHSVTGAPGAGLVVRA